MLIKNLETLLSENHQFGIPEFSLQTQVLDNPPSSEDQIGEQRRLREEYELLPEMEKNFVHTHLGKLYLYSSPERYVNHSDTPNTIQNI